MLLVIGSSLKVHPVSSIPGKSQPITALSIESNSISIDFIPPSVPQILINRESLDHNFDIELLGDCDVILMELLRRLGHNSLIIDSSVQELITPPIQDNPVEPRFVEPKFYLFPGAKESTNVGDLISRTNVESPVSSEMLIGGIEEEVLDVGATTADNSTLVWELDEEASAIGLFGFQDDVVILPDESNIDEVLL